MTEHEKKQRYEFIAHQINREDSLVNNRLTWTLTLNGFLFTALGFLAGKEAPNQKILDFFHWALPLTGCAVTLAGFLGIVAAGIQIKYLTTEWKKLEDEQWVRPFGGNASYFLGGFPSYAPPLILMLVWVGLYLSW
jgi:ABC-type dipeptide/oligopeptide/nickel transport system permease component